MCACARVRVSVCACMRACVRVPADAICRAVTSVDDACPGHARQELRFHSLGAPLFVTLSLLLDLRHLRLQQLYWCVLRESMNSTVWKGIGKIGPSVRMG